MQISLLYIVLNDLTCDLHILVCVLNILKSESVQIGHFLHPSRYVTFHTISDVSAQHVTSPLVTLSKGMLFWRLSWVPVIVCSLDEKRVLNHIVAYVRIGYIHDQAEQILHTTVHKSTHDEYDIEIPKPAPLYPLYHSFPVGLNNELKKINKAYVNGVELYPIFNSAG